MYLCRVLTKIALILPLMVLVVTLPEDSYADVICVKKKNKVKRKKVNLTKSFKISAGTCPKGFVAVIDVSSFKGAKGPQGVSGSEILWEIITKMQVQAESNYGYIATNDSEVIVTAPLNPNIGDIIRVVGAGEGGWRVVIYTRNN